MESGVLLAIAAAVAIIVVAVLATWLLGSAKKSRHDLNASRRDGDAAATWIGINAARDQDLPNDPHGD